MSNDKHYHPAIACCLQGFVRGDDWQGLVRYLGTLSHAQFRTAGYMLGERLVPGLPEARAWVLVRTLVAYDARAFLGTMLKAVSAGIGGGVLHLRSAGARAFLAEVARSPIDVQKTLAALLPEMQGPEDVEWLLRRLGVEDGEGRIGHLMRVATLPCSFALFHALKYTEHNRSLLVRVTVFLMKRGDAVGFNLASLVRTYYGLEEVRGTFSLRIEPYQLARIERNYDAFSRALHI